MIENPFRTVSDFDWKELDGKWLEIKVIEPNPEVLEFMGTAMALDIETMTIYILHEWDVREKE